MPEQQPNELNRAGSSGDQQPPIQPSWLRNSNPGAGPRGPHGPRRAWWSNIWLMAALGLLILNVTTVFHSRPSANPVLDIPYSIFLTQLNEQNVSTQAGAHLRSCGRHGHLWPRRGVAATVRQCPTICLRQRAGDRERGHRSETAGEV
jgi:hypothetical protein